MGQPRQSGQVGSVQRLELVVGQVEALQARNGLELAGNARYLVVLQIQVHEARQVGERSVVYGGDLVVGQVEALQCAHVNERVPGYFRDEILAEVDTGGLNDAAHSHRV